MNRLTSIERGAGIGAAFAGALPGVAVPMLLVVSAQDVELVTVAFLAVALVLPLAVGFNAAVHARSDRALALTALWLATLLLIAFTALSIASVGLLFVPSALLALASAVAGSIRAIANMFQPQQSSHF